MIEVVCGYSQQSRRVWYGVRRSGGTVRRRFATHDEAEQEAHRWAEVERLGVEDRSDRGTGLFLRLCAEQPPADANDLVI